MLKQDKKQKKFKINNGSLKTNQIPIAGIHSIFSALKKKIENISLSYHH